uniref:Uncharacterized protein n=1 Tax=Rhizophora mucronata TaxID=61149 RepID=A0A2P2N8G5_RHIMU
MNEQSKSLRILEKILIIDEDLYLYSSYSPFSITFYQHCFFPFFLLLL